MSKGVKLYSLLCILQHSAAEGLLPSFSSPWNNRYKHTRIAWKMRIIIEMQLNTVGRTAFSRQLLATSNQHIEVIPPTTSATTQLQYPANFMINKLCFFVWQQQKIRFQRALESYDHKNTIWEPWICELIVSVYQAIFTLLLLLLQQQLYLWHAWIFRGTENILLLATVHT